jgi:tRNA threonylcarbamoyladenosine biosynthesis protein TsaB
VGLEVALETSGRPPGLAARAGERTLERELSSERAHASDLMPALDALVRELGATPADVSAVYVGTGPGSYTGLRVGVATAQGLALGCGAPLVGVPSLELLAWSALAQGERGAFALDARQGEVYLARYERRGTGLEVLTAPCAVAHAGLGALLVEGEPLWADAGVRASALPQGLDLRVAPPARAALLLELGARALAAGLARDPRSVEPLYLRPFAVRPARA